MKSCVSWSNKVSNLEKETWYLFGRKFASPPSLVHLGTYLHTYLLAQLLSHFLTRSLTYSLTRLLDYLLAHLFAYFFRTHLNTCIYAYWLIFCLLSCFLPHLLPHSLSTDSRWLAVGRVRCSWFFFFKSRSTASEALWNIVCTLQYVYPSDTIVAEKPHFVD